MTLASLYRQVRRPLQWALALLALLFLARLLAEPLLVQLQPNPPGIWRNLVCCTGNDYCHFSLIDTKTRAVELAPAVDVVADPCQRSGSDERLEPVACRRARLYSAMGVTDGRGYEGRAEVRAMARSWSPLRRRTAAASNVRG